MSGGRGSAFERLVAASVEGLEARGCFLLQTSPRFVPQKFLPSGKCVGYFASKGGLDFYGHYYGRFVTFDCKSCKLKTRFPLDSIHGHQAHMVGHAHLLGGIAFFLIEMAELDGGPRYYALTWPVLEPYWSKYRLGLEGASSIPLAVLESECIEVKTHGGGFLDILSLLEKLTKRGLRDAS
ncbi:Holliday junction resolvase RecU [compost metagenome]